MKAEKRPFFLNKDHAQMAVEYLLLLTICALIAFALFRTTFQESGRGRNAMKTYFNKVHSSIIGNAP